LSAEAQRAYRARHPERAREADRPAKRRWNARNAEKIRAHTAVHNAIRRRKLQRGPCEVCGADRVHAHHDDYSKPLVVRWLCPLHHRQLHNGRLEVIEQ
jgi:hypothetical protein